MKKKILFYVGWDIVFLCSLYAYSQLSLKINAYTKQALDFTAYLWIQPLCMILLGGILALLIHQGRKYQTDRKSAVLELLIVGLPALYAATPFIAMFWVPNVWGIMFPYSIYQWLMYSFTVSSIAGVLLGYELFIFIFRMFSLHKKDKAIEEVPSDS